MQVLVCDDHAVFGESLALVLGRAGYDVAGVTRNPDEALIALRKSAVDVCVMDLLYAGTDEYRAAAGGAHTLSRLHELREANPSTRFVLLSGHLTREVIAGARAAGVRGFAHKGCHVGEIVATIARVHAGEEVVRSEGGSFTPPTSEPPNDFRRMAAFLTSREREVLGYLVKGADTTIMSKSMGVSWTTARSHIQSVLTKLGVHSRLEAATAAVRNGVVSGDTGEWLLSSRS
ncbi:MAG TPA: response regulator transcription factor [Jatrophihabitans sp.]|jgi:DNA-binding NarL/FixJ family response regulator